MVAAVHVAAWELLEEVGFEQLQLPVVADRAQVNKTTVYRRWPTRVDLVADLMDSFTRINVADPDSGSFRGDLEALLGAIASALSSRAIRSVLRSGTEAAERDAQIREAQKAFWERRFELSGVIVERAIASGELPYGTDPRAVLEMAAGPVYFRALFTADPLDAPFLEDVVVRTVRAFAS